MSLRVPRGPYRHRHTGSGIASIKTGTLAPTRWKNEQSAENILFMKTVNDVHKTKSKTEVILFSRSIGSF
jgi:hypothetical protein